jgi:hypothetical protein
LGDGTGLGGHLARDLDHPLRADCAVGAGEVDAPGGDLARRPSGQPFGERLAVLDEGLVREHRRAKTTHRLVGEPQLREVREGLEQKRVGPALEQGLGLLQEDLPRLLRANGSHRDERASKRPDRA